MNTIQKCIFVVFFCSSWFALAGQSYDLQWHQITLESRDDGKNTHAYCEGFLQGEIKTGILESCLVKSELEASHFPDHLLLIISDNRLSKCIESIDISMGQGVHAATQHISFTPVNSSGYCVQSIIPTADINADSSRIAMSSGNTSVLQFNPSIDEHLPQLPDEYAVLFLISLKKNDSDRKTISASSAKKTTPDCQSISVDIAGSKQPDDSQTSYFIAKSQLNAPMSFMKYSHWWDVMYGMKTQLFSTDGNNTDAPTVLACVAFQAQQQVKLIDALQKSVTKLNEDRNTASTITGEATQNSCCPESMPKVRYIVPAGWGNTPCLITEQPDIPDDDTHSDSISTRTQGNRQTGSNHQEKLKQLNAEIVKVLRNLPKENEQNPFYLALFNARAALLQSGLLDKFVMNGECLEYIFNLQNYGQCSEWEENIDAWRRITRREITNNGFEYYVNINLTDNYFSPPYHRALRMCIVLKDQLALKHIIKPITAALPPASQEYLSTAKNRLIVDEIIEKKIKTFLTTDNIDHLFTQCVITESEYISLLDLLKTRLTEKQTASESRYLYSLPPSQHLSPVNPREVEITALTDLLGVQHFIQAVNVLMMPSDKERLTNFTRMMIERSPVKIKETEHSHLRQYLEAKTKWGMLLAGAVGCNVIRLSDYIGACKVLTCNYHNHDFTLPYMRSLYNTTQERATWLACFVENPDSYTVMPVPPDAQSDDEIRLNLLKVLPRHFRLLNTKQINVSLLKLAITSHHSDLTHSCSIDAKTKHILWITQFEKLDLSELLDWLSYMKEISPKWFQKIEQAVDRVSQQRMNDHQISTGGLEQHNMFRLHNRLKYLKQAVLTENLMKDIMKTEKMLDDNNEHDRYWINRYISAKTSSEEKGVFVFALNNWMKEAMALSSTAELPAEVARVLLQLVSHFHQTSQPLYADLILNCIGTADREEMRRLITQRQEYRLWSLMKTTAKKVLGSTSRSDTWFNPQKTDIWEAAVPSCKICSKPQSKPFTLHCGHTSCHVCGLETARTRGQCPICKLH